MSPASLQCPSVARPNNPLGELFECPLGKLPKRSTRRAFQTICLANFPNDPLGELLERSTRRATRTVRPTNFPSRSLCFSRAPTSPNAAMRLANSKHISQWLHDACPHRPADEPSSATLTNRHRPRQRPATSRTDDPSPFSRKLRARFPCGWQKPLRERNDHERFRKQTQRQTRKRPPQPPSTPIATHKEEPWARNTTEESEPTKDS